MLFRSTARHGLLLANEISVISPYREQVWRIRTRLRQIGHGGVDVGNVEALQVRSLLALGVMSEQC